MTQNKPLSNRQRTLIALKAGWKDVVEKQYLTEPDKVRNANPKKAAQEMFQDPRAKATMFIGGIQRADVERLLGEIKEEVIKEAEDKENKNVNL
jgi:hypothetical protein